MKGSKSRWKNPSKSAPITEGQAVRIANAEVFRLGFNPDYYQVLKRISDAPQGLRNGSAPGSVGA